MEIVNTLDPRFCAHCAQVRYKHSLRQEIAKKLYPESAYEFAVLSRYACCPFHRHFTMPTNPKKRKVTYSDTSLELEWWTNTYNYFMSFDLKRRTVEFKRLRFSDEEDVFVWTAFNFDSIFIDILKLLSREELENLVFQIKKSKYE